MPVIPTLFKGQLYIPFSKEPMFCIRLLEKLSSKKFKKLVFRESEDRKETRMNFIEYLMLC